MTDHPQEQYEEDKILQELESLKINKINLRFNQGMLPPTKNYYRRLTLSNIALEERLFDNIIQGIYNGQGIFEWNIDGYSEYNILRKL